MDALRRKGRIFPPVMLRIQRRQAMLPAGAEALRNARGSAPGMWLESGRRVVVSLPGVPHEMHGLFEAAVLPRLQPRVRGVVVSRHYRFAPFFESSIEAAIGARLKALHGKHGFTATVLARAGECSLILTVRAATRGAAAARLRRVAPPLLAALSRRPYTHRGETPEAAVQRRVEAAGVSLSLAESLTGGLLAERLTRQPGASRWLAGGMVCYQNRSKLKLGVPAALLERHGAVSAPVAKAMARAAKRTFSTDYALATTGYAGPEGGDARNPVGTYFVALAGPRGLIRVESFLSVGARPQVREQAATHAMMLLLDALKKH
jgi:nicotinamide-nucleotide amidase